jgi:hypothetical protein
MLSLRGNYRKYILAKCLIAIWTIVFYFYFGSSISVEPLLKAAPVEQVEKEEEVIVGYKSTSHSFNTHSIFRLEFIRRSNKFVA